MFGAQLPQKLSAKTERLRELQSFLSLPFEDELHNEKAIFRHMFS